jgi:hypothetical protein
MIQRQHVWLGPEATSFAEPCEACLATRDQGWQIGIPLPSTVEGTLRRDADVGFVTCRRGHRIIVHRVGRLELAPLWH